MFKLRLTRLAGICKCRSFARGAVAFFLILPVAGFSPSCDAQVQVVAPDVYSHFVGVWVGYDDTILGGAIQHIPVQIVIAEEKGGKSVRMDYTYASKGKAFYSRATKYMELDPIKARLAFHWEHDSREIYKAKGLTEFAANGFGMFTATGAAPGPTFANAGSTGLFTLELGSDTLAYRWQTVTFGGRVATVSVFNLHRANVLSTKAQSN